MASAALVWELVKRNNSFMAKNLNGQVWSKEKGNLASKSTFKYSGLANLNNTVGVSEVGGAVAIQTSSKKSAGKLNTTLVKKNARRTIYAVGQVAGVRRADLKVAAKARAAAFARALAKRKATAPSS